MKFTLPRYPLISVDPNVCMGKPHVVNTRITVAAILAHLAGGMTIEKMLEEFPRLTKESIQQALAFASGQVEDQYLLVESAAV